MRSLDPNAKAAIVARVAVTELFGQYNYRLPQEGRLSDAAILYGDNGSGKTTLLNLIFHMLSPAGNRGHRTAIASVPFRRFEIELSDGTTFSATRGADLLVGGYLLECRKQGEMVARWDYEPRQAIAAELESAAMREVELARRALARRLRERGKERGKERGESAYLKALDNLNLGVYFLSADRQIRSDSLQEEGSMRPDVTQLVYHHADVQSAGDLLIRTHDIALNQALRNAWQWIGRQAVVGTNVGSDNVNSIYVDIVRRIARSKKGSVTSTDLRTQKDKVESALLAIAQQSNEYARYEFMAPLKADELVDGLKQAKGKTAQVVISVLEPYIEGAQARREALREIFNLTETFVKTLNEFYVDKSIQFGLTRGFKVTNSAGAELQPNHLSSGEQQLLLLFCHTLIARDKPSIFIIDEPELSLNVKWQRELIKSLLDVVSGSEIQFLFASHSIEMLAQHRDKVIQLRHT